MYGRRGSFMRAAINKNVPDMKLHRHLFYIDFCRKINCSLLLCEHNIENTIIHNWKGCKNWWIALTTIYIARPIGNDRAQQCCETQSMHWSIATRKHLDPEPADAMTVRCLRHLATIGLNWHARIEERTYTKERLVKKWPDKIKRKSWQATTRSLGQYGQRNHRYCEH